LNRSTGETVAVDIGTVRIRASDSGTITTPGEARKLAAGVIGQLKGTFTR
jgi:hypothetical protein